MRDLFILVVIFTVTFSISAQTVAFTNVNVIPMDKERVLENQTVLVRGGFIVEIGKVKIPKDAQVIEAKGKYLIPGLVDMHTHLLSDGHEYPDSIAEDELRVMVANGVTTIRFMIGTPELLALRARSAKGEITAPTIFVASPHLTAREQGNNFVVNTPDEAREAVRKSKAAGYDFIKITTFVKAEVYEAAVDEAAKQNIRVVGHADSRFVGVERAWKAKQQIEHLDGYMEMLLRDDAPMKGSISDLYIYNPDNWKSFDYIDESKIPEIARKTVASNPFVNPTQHFMKNTFGRARSEESIRAQPDFKFYPVKVQNQWLEFYKKTRLNQVPLEKRARWIELREKLIKAIYDAGGKIMAGSDTPEFLFLYGFSEHRELKALADAGLSNYAVLAAGTRNAHEFLRTLDKVGTVEKGKRADLVLLNANPLENIGATENRAGVMIKGKWYTQAELNRWLDEIAPKISNSLLPEDKKTSSLDGFWEGEINREGKKWRIDIDISGAGSEIKSMVNFVDLDVIDIPFPIKEAATGYRLEKPQPSGTPVVFDGKVDGNVFAGKWSGLGVEGTFSMKRGEKRPKAYCEEEVTFTNGSVTLSGTLLVPIGKTKSSAVTIVHGSSPNERATYRSWARRFAERGIAALIYDKRGSGKSTGNTRAASMEDLADDALAGLNMLRSRPDIDSKKVGIAGHSQGGWIAPLAASRSKNVAFIIASGAAAVTPAEQSIYHRAGVMRREGITEPEIELATKLREKLYALNRKILNNDPTFQAERAVISQELIANKDARWFGPAELPPALAGDLPSRGALELLFYDITPVWRKLKVPALVMWGDRDTVVPVEKSRRIIEDLQAKAGNKQLTIKVFPGVDHSNNLVAANGEWDFPRAYADFDLTMVEWLLNGIV